MSRESQSDSGRKGAASQTKASTGTQCSAPEVKGDWLPAYTGGMGKAAGTVRDSDGDYDND